MPEIWRAVIGFNYEASSLGNIRNLISRRVLSPSLTGMGYPQVKLYRAGKGISQLVHRLVATAFNVPGTGDEVNHKNGIKADNRLENLEWCTSSENIKHALSTGLMHAPKGSKAHRAKPVIDTSTGIADWQDDWDVFEDSPERRTVGQCIEAGEAPLITALEARLAKYRKNRSTDV